MNKRQQLVKLHQNWAKKCLCELKKTATQPVPGDGNPDAKIVFIGEAPGKQEDLQGRSFVGAAGKFLAKMLKTIRVKREDVYITNIVKYRPLKRDLKRGQNRAPTTAEKGACHDWLLGELNLINPKLIIFLGRHSMSNFFPDLKISEAHGKLIVKKLKNIKTNHFLPLYHPAAALYNGGLRKTLVADFKKIPLMLTEIS